MKRQYIITLLLACLYSIGAWAGYTKEKKISDRFTTDSYSKLRITNQYGKVHINTWDKNEVTVSVVVTATATSEEKAQSMVNDVDIIQQKADNRFSYYTSVKRKKIVMNKDNELKIDYTVNMPASLYLELQNKFGDVFIDDFAGQLSVGVEYGAIKAQKLTGSNVNLQVEFGSLSVASAETATITSRYSKVNIDKGNKLAVSSRFGKTNISNTKRLVLSQDYGDAVLSNIEVLKGDISYSGFTIDRIGTEAMLNMQYCSKCNLGVISGKTERLSVHAKFSKLVCTIDESADMTVEIATRFGSVNKGGGSLSLQKANVEVDRYSSSYRGTIGSGAGNMAMSLEYTDVNFK